MLTNEEKRVLSYSGDDVPTVASVVTQNTPLESLNMNWREKDLPERERTKHVHRLHPYLGKYIPQLVEIFLRKYFKTGETVVDPFCGSGTTLVQANELGIASVGYDVSAFNVLLCRAKTARYDISLMRYEVLDILAKVKQELPEISRRAKSPHALAGDQLSLWKPGTNGLFLSSEDMRYLQQWFAQQALQELLAYLHHIYFGNYRYSELLKVILSRSARSARMTTHFDLDFPKRPQLEPYWCYKHSRECSPTTEAFKFLERYSLDTIKRVEEYARLRTEAAVAVHHADSRTAGVSKVDGVITSPPYVGLIDYHDQHAYAYHLLGLEDKRSQEIGPAKGGTSLKARQLYQQSIAQVFCNVTASMPTGGRLIVVAADRADLYPEIANLVGVEVEAVVQRHVNRRTGRRSGEFYESVFVWQKR